VISTSLVVSICIGVLFKRATEQPSESSCFDCLKVVEPKIVSGPGKT